MPPAQDLLAKAEEGISFLLQVLQTRPDSHGQYMSLAFRIISYIDQCGVMSSNAQLLERMRLVQGLQRYANFDPDVNGSYDAAQWCERQWNGILYVDPENAIALQGLGRYWLFRAQPLLTRIYDAEAALCGDDDLPTQQIACNVTKRVLCAATSEDNLSSQLEELRHGPAYVEARGLLNAAIGFLVRAINQTTAGDRAYGPLLVETGQAFMHLGSMQSGEASLHDFLKATRILQRAMQVPGLALPAHLRNYLQEYGRYS